MGIGSADNSSPSALPKVIGMKFEFDPLSSSVMASPYEKGDGVRTGRGWLRPRVIRWGSIGL